MSDMAEMQKRMALVEKLSALNSKQLQNTQARSGIEVELAACIDDIEENGGSEAAHVRRADLETSYKAAVAACADCDRKLDELADQLAKLDQAGLAGPGT